MNVSTTRIIQKIQEILVAQPEQTIEYASMKAGIELGTTIDVVKKALEDYRKAGF